MRKSKVVANGQMRKEFEMLKNHADVRAQFRQIDTRSTDIDPIYENASALERLKGVDGLNQGGFSGAGGPQITTTSPFSTDVEQLRRT